MSNALTFGFRTRKGPVAQARKRPREDRIPPPIKIPRTKLSKQNKTHNKFTLDVPAGVDTDIIRSLAPILFIDGKVQCSRITKVTWTGTGALTSQVKIGSTQVGGALSASTDLAADEVLVFNRLFVLSISGAGVNSGEVDTDVVWPLRQVHLRISNADVKVEWEPIYIRPIEFWNIFFDLEFDFPSFYPGVRIGEGPLIPYQSYSDSLGFIPVN